MAPDSGTAAPAAGAGTSAEPVIRVEDVAVRFGARTIFKGVTFEVRRGEIFVILGGSGCGKSTLLKTLIGLVPMAAGRAWLLGEELAATKGADRRALLRRLGVMWQSGALFGSMTLAQNVELPLEEHTDLPRPAREALARSKLGLVGLGDAAGRLPAEISGGMAKRAGIARAMALDPPLLFLDEPSAGLDPITSAGLDALIKDIARDTGATFVVVTHELQSILAIGDRCIMLDKDAQGMIAEGDPRRLREDSDNRTVRAFFRREAI
ncbi:ABC transporter ATP-binding protein [Roseomonas sp. HF4]|uniref:ABC transporter ATP-binding protein n=1 Tax=Roseomonas sp. HF4 TaxID=2562313 RepID=UPI0010BF7351|nr:ATP-binding cassette domain-containing protein [Roseomonas sp. HF4]